MGGDLRMFVDRARLHRHFRRLVRRHPDPLSARPRSSTACRSARNSPSRCAARRQRELVDEIAGLAEVARKQGPIGLEKVEIDDPFLAKGIRFVADGYDANFIRDNLERDRDNFLTHLDEGQKIYRAIGDCAPAFGMIGTLIGMVQMFANMTDPSKLGPFMATALLATFYGAALANLFCLPIADKLHLKLVDEEINRTLIIDGILMIRDAKSPTLVREMLLAYLPEKHRHAEAEDDEAAEAGGRRDRGEQIAMAKTQGGARRRSRLVRDLRRPDGPAGQLLRDAGRVLRRRISRSCRSSPARCATPSACRTACAIPASSRSTACRRGRKLKNVAQDQARRTPRRRRRPDEHDRKRTFGARFKQRPRLRARLRLAAPGAAGHAGDHRSSRSTS